MRRIYFVNVRVDVASFFAEGEITWIIKMIIFGWEVLLASYDEHGWIRGGMGGRGWGTEFNLRTELVIDNVLIPWLYLGKR